METGSNSSEAFFLFPPPSFRSIKDGGRKVLRRGQRVANTSDALGMVMRGQEMNIWRAKRRYLTPVNVKGCQTDRPLRGLALYNTAPVANWHWLCLHRTEAISFLASLTHNLSRNWHFTLLLISRVKLLRFWPDWWTNVTRIAYSLYDWWSGVRISGSLNEPLVGMTAWKTERCDGSVAAKEVRRLKVDWFRRPQKWLNLVIPVNLNVWHFVQRG